MVNGHFEILWGALGGVSPVKSECPCKLLGVGLWWLLIFFCSLTKRNRAANRFGNYVFFWKNAKMVRVIACHSRVTCQCRSISKGHLAISKGSLSNIKGSLKHQKGHLNIKRVTWYIEGHACHLRVARGAQTRNFCHFGRFIKGLFSGPYEWKTSEFAKS